MNPSWLVTAAKFLYFLFLSFAVVMGGIKFRGSIKWPPENLIAEEMKYSTGIWILLMILVNAFLYLFCFTGVNLIKVSLVQNNLVAVTIAELVVPLIVLVTNRLFPKSRLVWCIDGIFCILVPVATILISL